MTDDTPKFTYDDALSEMPAKRWDLWRVAMYLRTELLMTRALLNATIDGADQEVIIRLRKQLIEHGEGFDDLIDPLIGVELVTDER